MPGIEAITLKLNGYAELKAYAAGSLINSSEEGNRVRMELTFAPVTLNAKGEAKVKLTDDITIKIFSFKKSYEITKKYSWYGEISLTQNK